MTIDKSNVLIDAITRRTGKDDLIDLIGKCEHRNVIDEFLEHLERYGYLECYPWIETVVACAELRVIKVNPETSDARQCDDFSL